MDAVADAGAGVVFVVVEAVGGDGVELGGAGIVEVVERAAGGGGVLMVYCCCTGTLLAISELL